MKYSHVDRRAKAARSAALARPELRLPAGYTPVERQTPTEGREVTAWAKTPKDRQAYRLPFPVVFRNGTWFNAVHHNPLEVPIVGWHHQPPTKEKDFK